MPELLTVENIGTKGLNTDNKAWSLPPDFITFGVNFRIFANSIRSAGGHALWSTPPVNFFPGHLIHAGATGGDYWLVIGRDAVYSFDGTTWTDVSSAAGYAGVGVDDELLWSSCMLGQIPVINNPQAHPEYWSRPVSPGNILLPLPFDQTNTWKDMLYSFKILRSHKNYLFAMNLQENTDEFPDSFRWSHPADQGGIPPTWDETDDAFLAGKASLGGDGGQILDGRSLRDAFSIYSENAIDILDFTNDEFVWRRRSLSATVGLLARNCIVEIKGAHFFLADGDIVMNDGTSIKSIAHNRIRKQLTARINIDNFHRAYAVRNDALKEVWFCIPEEDAEYANVAYIYNWRDDSWAIRTIEESINVAYAGYGSQSDPTAKWDVFTDTDSWDSQTRVWGSAILTPLDDTIVGCSPADGSLYFLDPPGTPDNAIQSRIERTDFPLVDQREVTTITRVYPHMDGEAELTVQFGSQDHAGAPIRWKPAQTFNPATDRKLDVRTTGELHCWRFDSIGKDNWAMSGFDIEFERSGRR